MGQQPACVGNVLEDPVNMFLCLVTEKMCELGGEKCYLFVDAYIIFTCEKLATPISFMAWKYHGLPS
jgi:hypothetical protein